MLHIKCLVEIHRLLSVGCYIWASANCCSVSCDQLLAFQPVGRSPGTVCMDALGHISYGERLESALDLSIITLSCHAGLAVEQPDPSWGRKGIPKCF